MDLLEIRKRAKELKESEVEAKRAKGEETPGDTGAPPEAREAAAPAVKKAGGKARKKEKKRPDAKPKPEEGAAPVVTVDAVSVEAEGPAAAQPPMDAPSAGEAAQAALQAPSPVEADGPDRDAPVIEYLAFLLGKEEYAVKVDEIREIIRNQSITAIPRAPEFVMGIISLRGVILPVFDIKKRLGLEEIKSSRSTRIVVISDNGQLQGIIVDKVTGVVKLKADAIEPPPAVIGGVEAEYLEGVGRVKDRLLILFNTSKVLAMEGTTCS